MRRLFFALWPPDDSLRQALVAMRQPYVQAPAIRPLALTNLHLTLAFLGEVDAATQARLTAGAAHIRVAPFSIRVDKLGNWRHNGILWAGSSHTPDALHTLVHQLRQLMRDCKLATEKRPYQPHVTLARHCYHGPALPIDSSPLEWPCTQFVLVDSQRREGRLVYQPIHAWALASLRL